MSLVLPALGVGLVVLMAVDMFITVFHPEGHAGPWTQRQNSAVWWLWKKAAPAGDRRDAWLGIGGPLLAVLTPAVWSLMLIVGYALVYYPWMERFLVSPGSLRAHWAEALYYSGFAAATLGTGDIVPDGVPLRLLSIVEALSGFALLSASLSYILAVFRENQRKTTLASDLALHYEVGSSRSDSSSPAHERERWLETVARDLNRVIQAHAQYPILHYFRATDDDNSLALQLAPLVAHATNAPPGGTDTHDAPSSGGALVSGAVERYLAAADRRFVRSPSVDPSNDGLQVRYRRLLEYLGYQADEVSRTGR